MPKTLFKKYMLITSLIVVVSFLFLGTVMVVFISRYWQAERRDLLKQNAQGVALMSRLNAAAWGKADFDPFFGAPTVVVVFAEAGNPNGVQDASLVMGNMLNAAHAMGLGSCWINRAREGFEMPEGRALLEKWGVEGDWVGVGNCILGYADGPEPQPIARKEGYYRIIK